VNSERIELFRDTNLVVNAERNAFRLRPIAQGRIIDHYLLRIHIAWDGFGMPGSRSLHEVRAEGRALLGFWEVAHEHRASECAQVYLLSAA
jgi:hypothetical protein